MCDANTCAEFKTVGDTTLLRSNVQTRKHQTLTVKDSEMEGFKELVNAFAKGIEAGHQETRDYSNDNFTIFARLDGGAEFVGRNGQGGFSLDENEIGGLLDGLERLGTVKAGKWELVQTEGYTESLLQSAGAGIA